MLKKHHDWICAPAGGLSAGVVVSEGAVVRRPHGFGDFIRRQGFHSLYLVTTDNDAPVKVGIAEDPERRLSDLQSANFNLLRIYRFWWLPGRRVSERIERSFKDHFSARCVRGEWFDLLLPEAEAFVEAAIRSLGAWGVPEADVIEFMEHCARRRLDFCRG